MPDNLFNTHRGRGTWGNNLSVCLVMSLLVLTSVTNGSAAGKVASNKQPLSFGQGQTIIDLQKVVWESDVSLQPLENKALSWGIICKSPCILTAIMIRKSQYHFKEQVEYYAIDFWKLLVQWLVIGNWKVSRIGGYRHMS